MCILPLLTLVGRVLQHTWLHVVHCSLDSQSQSHFTHKARRSWAPNRANCKIQGVFGLRWDATVRSRINHPTPISIWCPSASDNYPPSNPPSNPPSMRARRGKHPATHTPSSQPRPWVAPRASKEESEATTRTPPPTRPSPRAHAQSRLSTLAPPSTLHVYLATRAHALPPAAAAAAQRCESSLK